MTGAHEAWMRGAERLSAAGIESARLDARLLLAHAMNLAAGELLSAKMPSPEEVARYDELLERRAAREPAAYITGEREFWSLSFEVGPGVLIPRPETETLIEEAMRHFPDRTQPLDVLDLGTGSGCLLIAFLKTYPNARGVGGDLSPSALGWALSNAELHRVSSRANWVEGTWSAAGDRTFDVIFSNPPYLAEGDEVAPEIARYEPRQALFAGPDGLDAYRALAPVIAAGLRPEGRAYLEIGARQADAVSRVLRGSGLQIAGIAPDLAGIPRCIGAGRAFPGSGTEITVGKRGSSG
jgi:release factor glutamine methyltransferase